MVKSAFYLFFTGAGTQTKDGLGAVTALTGREMVGVESGIYEPILWIGTQCITKEQFPARDSLAPITFLAGALGGRGCTKEVWSHLSHIGC